MLNPLQKYLLVALGGIALQATAAERPIQFPAYESSLTVAGTLSQSVRNVHKPGWAIGGESVYARDNFSSGGEIKYFPEGTDDPVFNAFVGMGYKRLAQFQVGFGTERAVYRFRSEVDLPWLWVLGRHVSNGNLSLPNRFDHYPNNRFVVIFSAEKYDHHEYLDNVSVGVGLRY